MKKRLSMLLTVCCLLAALSVPASALEYTVDAPDAGLFGTPTSDETVYVTEDEPANTDRSKSAAYIPPAFGSPTSYTLNAGERLTPNLLRDQPTAYAANASGGATTIPPAVSASPAGTVSSSTATGYTAVTGDLYYNAGHLGTLKIPDIGLTVKIYEGTGSAALKKGAGHFSGTSIWDGNVALAGHNRGVNNHFGKIHTLALGDEITLTTKLGTRTYEVTSVSKISVDDVSVLDGSVENTITLITCVMDQPDYRWMVRGVEK